MAEMKPGWFGRRLNSRARRDYMRVQERDLSTQHLADEGRYAELADALGQLVRDYAQQTSIEGHTRGSLMAWIRRCDALIRAGRRSLVVTESGALRAMLVEYEGPDGELAGILQETIATADQEAGRVSR